MNAATLEGLGEPATVVQRRTVPFDIAFRFTLSGVPNKVHRQIVVVSIEATFVAQSVGYGLVPTAPPITFGPPRPPRGGPITLGNLAFSQVIAGLATSLTDPGGRRRIGARVASVLQNGLRLNPSFATLTLGSFRSQRGLDDRIRANLFEAVAPTERVQFLYAFFDDATGREFQSEPILNIAGLGIADGDRPFRYFATPIVFKPRSTIRLEVTELTTFVGELHVALHGYKVLGGAGSPTGRAVRNAARRARLAARGGVKR